MDEQAVSQDHDSDEIKARGIARAMSKAEIAGTSSRRTPASEIALQAT
jgi:hypothetical protein